MFRFHAVLKPCIEFTAKSTLQTYEATPGKRRGFCTNCGSYVFYSGVTSDYYQIAVGCIDAEYLKEYGTVLTKEQASLYCRNEIPQVTDHLGGERFDTVPKD